MIDMKPQYVTPEDFLNYFGIDLNENLKGDNDSFKADSFLRRVEDRIMAWVDANTYRNFLWEQLRDDYKAPNSYRQYFVNEQKDLWKKAILNQAMYVFRNGEIGLDSGYDMEKGIVAKDNDLGTIEICRPSIDFMKRAGILNHVVKNGVRYTNFS